MPKYLICSKETIYYETIVEADSYSDAITYINSGGDPGEQESGQDFEIYFAELYKEEPEHA